MPDLKGTATTTIDADGGASSSVTRPTAGGTVTTGDLYVIKCVAYNSTGPATATDFEDFATTEIPFASEGIETNTTWLFKAHDGGEGGSFTVSPAGGSTYTYLTCFIVDGCDLTGTALENLLNSTHQSTVGAGFATVDETTDVANCFIISGFTGISASVSAEPSGYTSISNLDGGFSAVAYKIQVSAGSTGTDAWTGTGAAATARTAIALNPSPVADTIPAAVDDLAGTAGDEEVVLTWTAPDDGGATITDYVVQYREAATTP